MDKKRILIVDDMRTMHALIETYLGTESFDFDSAMSGREALEHARATRPDLILSDVRMSDVDGLELCRRVHGDAMLTDIPVLLISAQWEDAEEVQRSISVGAEALLPKPIDADVLRAAIDRVLRRTDSPATLPQQP